MKERLSKSLTINPVEGQIDSKSTESSCLQDKDSAVETSISISLRKRGKDASKEALTYTYTTAILIDIDQCGLRTLIPELSESLVFMPTSRDAKEEGRLTTVDS